MSNMFYWGLRQEAAEFQAKMIQLLKLLTSVASRHHWGGGLRTVTVVRKSIPKSLITPVNHGFIMV